MPHLAMPHSFSAALRIIGFMIAVVLLLAVLATGCASLPEAPRTYNQSAMPMPRAPAFNPTTDSPITVGQPGYVEPAARLQPNPRPTRVLPEDEKTRREAGLWATNAPRAGTPRILEFLLETDEERSLDDVQIDVMCAELMAHTITTIDKANRLAALPDERQRKCVAATLYAACAHELLAGNNRAKNDGEYDAIAFARFIRADRRAKTFRETACKGVAIPEDVPPLCEKIYGGFLLRLELLTNAGAGHD